MSKFLSLRNHQTNPISRLLIHRSKNKLVKWFLHVPVIDQFAIAQNFIYSQFPLCRVASQLDVVTLSSNVFPSCTIQNNCGNFFNLDSRFAKAGRRLGPVYMEVGVPMLVRWLA